ncbi:DEAD/DEAH box helicase [Candidatus Woesearchaeota archaeon]|nr:DEAD/DEAH box helicase [Candidatus Woesearchaeota archaeon]
MLRDVTPRLYQQTILATASTKNTLVVLPTGLGKTLIAILLCVQRLRAHPESKILLVTPTRPLAEQHYHTFQHALDLPASSFSLFTGHVPPAKRATLWKDSTIIFTTPQGLENDVINRSIDLSVVSLLIVDEAHRAVGDYSYVYLAKEYIKHAQWPRVLGLSASPGEDIETILEVCANLCIEDVEIRTLEDPDVKPYVQDLDISWEYIDLPSEILTIKKHLEAICADRLTQVKQLGYIQSADATKGQLLGLQKHLFAEMASGTRTPEQMKSISLLAETLKVDHGLELLETQGLSQALSYLERIEDESRMTTIKAVKNLVADPRFRTALLQSRQLTAAGFVHPKLPKIIEMCVRILHDDPRSKIIIFTQFRETGSRVVEGLKTQGLSSHIFVGQAKKGETGMSQKVQAQTLAEFKEGKFNVLVATSVAEEGLDIPSVDHVIFYEPVPSAIRAIQRRGRTGRHTTGNVRVLLARGTRDEAYRWASHHKEKRMHRILRDLKKQIALQQKPATPHTTNAQTPQRGATSQQSLFEFATKQLIYADYREKGSDVIKNLLLMGADLRLQQLQIGDFAISERVVVEYKTVDDFVTSLLDGRLIPQLRELKRNYWKPHIIVEGMQSIYEARNVHPNSISGMIATITSGFGIPIVMTRTPVESARMILALARREQDVSDESFSPHGERKAQSTREAQEYIVSAFPGIGPQLAKPILRKFGTLRAFVSSSEEELRKVDLIGEKKARAIKRVVDDEWTDQS